jgi:predicted esterase YcpF (UPF0227 family)
VLINPAVYPDRDLERYIGEHSSWHDPETRFFFRPEYIPELQALGLHGKAPAGPELGLIAKGDELLDWREMLARYPLAEHILIEGSDHALSGFEAYIPDICDFLQLALNARPPVVPLRRKGKAGMGQSRHARTV